MNYKPIIDNSFRSENLVNPKAYFIREFKKVNRDYFYEAKDFFNGFIHYLDQQEEIIRKKFNEYLAALELEIQNLEDDKHTFYDSYYGGLIDKQGKSYSDYHKERRTLHLESYKRLLETADIYDGKCKMCDYSLKTIELVRESVQLAFNELTGSDNDITCQPKLSSKKMQPIVRKFTAKENALAYIFDLHAAGDTVPLNLTEGSNAKNVLLEVGALRGFTRPDTFYRAVTKVLKYDLNSKKELNLISLDWLGVLEELSEDFGALSKFLESKGLTGNNP